MSFSAFVDAPMAKVASWYAGLEAWNVEGGSVPLWSLLLAVLLGALVAVGPYWRLLRVGATFFHELGHALAGLVVGAKVRKISLNLDTSGVTHWSFPGNPGRLRTAWVAWWGYPAPSLVGGAGFLALSEGWGRSWAAALTLTVATVLLFWVRNLWGILVCSVFGALAGLVVWQGAPAGELLAALFSSFLVVGGVRTVYEHYREGSAPGSDSVVVSRQVFLPAGAVRVTMLSAAVSFPTVLAVLPFLLR